MRRGEETTKIIEVRIRSELGSVTAVEGKSSCFFAPALNQKLNWPTQRTGGLDERCLY